MTDASTTIVRRLPYSSPTYDTVVCLLSDPAVLCTDHVRLFQRLRKYTARGITVVNVPPEMLSAGFPKALLQLMR